MLREKISNNFAHAQAVDSRPVKEARAQLASIPGRVFAFITVRRTTRPGTSCLRMRQIFIVFVVGKKY